MNINHLEGIRDTLGEGSIWDEKEQLLWWLDIDGKLIHNLDPVSHIVKTWTCQERISTIVPTRSEYLLIAGEKGIGFFDTEKGKTIYIHNPEKNIPQNRFNDGKCSPEGRFWAGTISETREKGTASLYCMHTDNRLVKAFGGVTNSNGLVWGKKGTVLYYIDTPTQSVQAFPYDREKGTLGQGEAVITIPEQTGHPDGMTIDQNGNLWIALYHGASVGCWNPDTGELIEKIDLPARRITSCAFGGADFSTLYITSASHNMTEEEQAGYPLSGSLFYLKMSVKGQRCGRWAGKCPSEHPGYQ